LHLPTVRAEAARLAEIAVRCAGKRAHGIASKLRQRTAAGRDDARAAVRRVTGELADLTETAASDAERLLANSKRALRRPAPRPRN
jgi:transposase, IS5 family